MNSLKDDNRGRMITVSTLSTRGLGGLSTFPFFVFKLISFPNNPHISQFSVLQTCSYLFCFSFVIHHNITNTYSALIRDQYLHEISTSNQMTSNLIFPSPEP
ncbi:hypothetical protein OCU04_012479 [Sclerotinia nivalis]|uniref:Uncharacterized protein n=1 Tax=Sclerotinia nivalis TaxID=352851 RepID=A0A9X0A8N3_9HELO|nr:hypothetical protein OCU04_012479 [Sclerotinia nivalis]